MKQIKLPAQPHKGEIKIDATFFAGYNQTDEGIDLICGNPDCTHIMYPKYPPHAGGDTMHVEGIQCPSCGWDNTLSTGTIK